MIKGIEIGILTNAFLTEKRSGRVFLEMLPHLYEPQWHNLYEPINKPFTTVDEALESWSGGFLWRRAKPRMAGDVLFGSNKVHARVILSLSPKAFNREGILELFRRMCETFGVDVAYIYISTSTQADDFDHYKRFTMPFNQGLSTFDLREGLPGFCWAMVFGKPYLEIFGDRMKDIPIYSSERMKDAIYLQLTESYKDIGSESYLQAEIAAKQHLNNRMFRTSDLTEKYRIPEFSYPYKY